MQVKEPVKPNSPVGANLAVNKLPDSSGDSQGSETTLGLIPTIIIVLFAVRCASLGPGGHLTRRVTPAHVLGGLRLTWSLALLIVLAVFVDGLRVLLHASEVSNLQAVASCRFRTCPCHPAHECAALLFTGGRLALLFKDWSVARLAMSGVRPLTCNAAIITRTHTKTGPP